MYQPFWGYVAGLASSLLISPRQRWLFSSLRRGRNPQSHLETRHRDRGLKLLLSMPEEEREEETGEYRGQCRGEAATRSTVEKWR